MLGAQMSAALSCVTIAFSLTDCAALGSEPSLLALGLEEVSGVLPHRLGNKRFALDELLDVGDEVA